MHTLKIKKYKINKVELNKRKENFQKFTKLDWAGRG